MIGTHHTHIRQNGPMCRNVVAMMLAFSLCLSGCSTDFYDWLVGDGRGDWTQNLISGYCLVKVNSRCIEIGYKDHPDDTNSSDVIPCYFITAYQIKEPYIALEGIPTQKFSITDEELETRELNYYLIDTTTGIVNGPYETMDAMIEYCSSLAVDISSAWVKVDG